MDVDQWVGAGERDIRPEERRQDLDAPGEAFERLRGDGLADRTEETVPLPVGDGSADDDPMRVEAVHEPDAGDGDRATGLGHERRAGRVAGILAGRDVARRQGFHADDRRTGGQGAAIPGVHGGARVAGERGPRGDRFEVADAAAAAAGSVEHHRDVPQLAGQPVRTVEQPAAADDPATDPGRHGQVDEVVAVAAGAERRLPERGHVRVAVQEGRQAERRLDLAGERDMVEVRAEVRRLDDRARERVHRPGRGIPMPASWSATVAGAADRADRSAAMQAATIAAGPSALGVRVALRASREPSGRTTAARMWVPPRSSARTGRGDRVDSGFVSGKAGTFYQSRGGIPGLRAGSSCGAGPENQRQGAAAAAAASRNQQDPRRRAGP